MNALSPGWKLFRIICILQMVSVAFQWMLSVSSLFYGSSFLYHAIAVLVYSIVFLFVYSGLSLLNDNYPDTPLSDRQRRRFNWLFLLNVLFVAYLFGQVVNYWRAVWPYLDRQYPSRTGYLSLLPYPLMVLCIFIFHMVFLAGMFRLRRVIYRNTMNNWYQQFGEEQKIRTDSKQ